MAKLKKNSMKEGGAPLKKQTIKKVLELKKMKLEASKSESTADYDSMIENGTSDESEDFEAGVSSTHKPDESTSDDGFSEREESTAEETKPTKQQITQKRKLPEASAKSNENKKSKKHAEKVKPPTLEEINELKETRNLFHSNLFRLQVKEMLTELKVKEKYTNYLNKWLITFKAFLEELENAPAKENIHEMRWYKDCGIQLPLNLSDIGNTQKPFQFQFIKPTEEPFYIGAVATQTLLGPQLVADVCVLMPPACFQKENYLNLVYDQKRAYYLTYLTTKMSKSKYFVEQEFTFNYHANNPLKPILELIPKDNKFKKLSVRVHVAPEAESFKLNRFVPWNSNIRGTLYGDEVDEEAAPLATPHYNANVLQDLTLQSNQKLLNDTFAEHKNFQEGLLLLKVWLRQRQLNFGYCGFGAHILAMYIAYLYKQHKLNVHMSSYQVARTVWNQLANTNWEKAEHGISLASKNDAPNQPTIEQFKDYYDVVFVDVSGFYNICANVPLDVYVRVRQEAKLAVDMLNDMKLNSFQLIFMTKCPLFTQFDHILKIQKPDVVEQVLELHVKPVVKYDYANHVYPQLLRTVAGLLSKGLKARVSGMLPIEQPLDSWSITAQAPSGARYLQLGLILNPEQAFEVIDKGPESIAPEALEFRKFWGDKAQLRRFQDGSIVESVVWCNTTDALVRKRLIVRDIVLHLMQLHYQLDPADVEYIAGEFDMLYKLTPSFKIDSLQKINKIAQDIDAESLTPAAIHCFDQLARQLQRLKDLPLEIVSITGTSPVFRYCEPEPILPEARFINEQFYAKHVLRGVMQLGMSGKWPSELGALRALKTAFYIQIAKMLREDSHLKTKVTYDGVLVLKQGYCFAIELAHPKEVALLKKEKTERGLTQYVDCPASIELEKRHYILPKVTGALHALYQEHPAFGGTTMLAKRWLGTQLIDDGLWPHEATELLVATLFLKTHAPQQTCTPQTGFYRFLQLLANSDWKSELFLLNFNNAMDETQISELEQNYRSARDTFPPLCIATAYDQQHSGHLWTTHQQPSMHVLARVTLLARQALSILEPTLVKPNENFIKPVRLFTASNQGYDLVIQIKPDLVRNTLCSTFGSPFAAFSKPNWKLPLAGTDYLRDAVQQLREAYADYAAFFYNPYGGKEIGIVWKPNEVFAAKPFKVTEVNGCALSANEIGKIQCYKETLIEDFKFILKDYYLRIDTVEVVLRDSHAAAQRYHAQPQQTKENKFDKTKMGKNIEQVKNQTKQGKSNKTRTQHLKTEKITKAQKNVKPNKLKKVKHTKNATNVSPRISLAKTEIKKPKNVNVKKSKKNLVEKQNSLN